MGVVLSGNNCCYHSLFAKPLESSFNPCGLLIFFRFKKRPRSLIYVTQIQLDKSKRFFEVYKELSQNPFLPENSEFPTEKQNRSLNSFKGLQIDQKIKNTKEILEDTRNSPKRLSSHLHELLKCHYFKSLTFSNRNLSSFSRKSRNIQISQISQIKVSEFSTATFFQENIFNIFFYI